MKESLIPVFLSLFLGLIVGLIIGETGKRTLREEAIKAGVAEWASEGSGKDIHGVFKWKAPMK